MKRFIIKSGILILLVVGSFFSLFFLADGYTDPFYVRFTTPAKTNLIIGTSKAAQGVQPRVLDTLLDKSFFNYAFTNNHSPFGPVYFESIKKKLDTTGTEAIFIVTVDPWSIAVQGGEPEHPETFREASRFLADLDNVSASPNWAYLLDNLQGHYYKLLPAVAEPMFLHDDGWLEVEIPVDSLKFEEKSLWRANLWRQERLDTYRISALRVAYLEKTISYLSDHGRVYLVRLPTHEAMLAIENDFMPDFNEQISGAIDMAAGYLDLTPEAGRFLYTDGNHLYRDSGKEVSAWIGEYIQNREEIYVMNQRSESTRR